MLLRTTVITCALHFVVSGCAATVVECQGQNWYRLGLDDGRAGAQDERKRYEASCGSDFNAKQYQQGLQEGLSEQPKPAK